MKTHIITIFCASLLLCPVLADKPKPSMFFPTGSDWVHYDGSCPETHYPIIIQGGMLEGDGTTFRAIFAKIPSQDFQYVALHGLRAAQYEKRVKELSDLGYTLIYHQQCGAMVGFNHQAVWVRMAAIANKGEQDGADQPAPAVDSKSEGIEKPKSE